MKVNHRDGTVARRDHGAGYNKPLRDLKYATARNRRANEREVLNALRGGSFNGEDAVFASNNELDDLWNWD